MARQEQRLTARRVLSLNSRGNYADGGGLYLQVTAALTKSWLFRFSRDGRAREMGLGSLAKVSLTEARAKAEECRRLLAAGLDPIEVRKTRQSLPPAPVAEAEPTTAQGKTPLIPAPQVGKRAVMAWLTPADQAQPINPAAGPVERDAAFYYQDDNGQFVPSAVVPGPEMAVEGHITTPWLEVNVRRLSLNQPLDAIFRSPLCCLGADLSAERQPGDQFAYWERASSSELFRVGDCTFVPAGQTIHFRSTWMQCRKVTCLFDATKFDAFRDWEWRDAELALCLDLKQPRVREGLLLLAKEALQPGFASEVLAESLVMGMIVELARGFRNVAAARLKPGLKLADWQLGLIRDQVESASGPPPSLTALAGACAVSPRHLARLFKNSTGMTLGAFVADARIRQAKALLARPERMIKAIAYECGFQTPAAFAAAFRKVTGRSPRQYRLDVLATWA